MNNKFRIILSVIGVVISILLLVISTILAEEALISPVTATVLIIISVILVFIAIFFAAKVDYETGVYECRKCGHKYIPSYKAVAMAPHMGRTRKMRCPECGQKSWQKKLVSKE